MARRATEECALHRTDIYMTAHGLGARQGGGTALASDQDVPQMHIQVFECQVVQNQPSVYYRHRL